MNVGILILAGLAVSTFVGLMLSYVAYSVAKEKEPLKYPTYSSFVRENTGYNFSSAVEKRRNMEESKRHQ